MPLPADIALADDIVAELNDRWSGTFSAERTWVPDWDARIELESLQVAVQPSPHPTGEMWDRSGLARETWPIDVGFAQRLSARDCAEIDTLLGVVDEVREFLQFAEFTLPDGRHFQGRGFEFLARFDPDLIRRQLVDGQVVYAGAFLSVVRFPFDRRP